MILKELSSNELQKINGKAWPILVKVAVWAAGIVVGYYTVEAIQGIEDGLSGECCDCDCP